MENIEYNTESPESMSSAKRLVEAARKYGRELADEAAERDILHPGADELPAPLRGELFQFESRWKRPENLPCDEADPWKPLVSIVVPVYNKQDIVRRCLVTVLGQTYENLQVILVNDGSGDESLAVISWLTRDDPRVVIVDQQNGGVSHARNTALEHATGEWVYFCDSDDWLEPDCVERLVSGVLKNGCDMAIADFYRVRGTRYESRVQMEEGVFTLAEFTEQMIKKPANFYYGALWNKIFRRSLIEENGLRFDEDVEYGEDHLFILDYLSTCSRVLAIASPVYYYFDNPGSLVHQSMNPTGIAKNKTNTYERYKALCEACGLRETTGDMLRVAGFLLAPATDALVLPFDKVLHPEQIPL